MVTCGPYVYLSNLPNKTTLRASPTGDASMVFWAKERFLVSSLALEHSDVADSISSADSGFLI